MKPQEFKSSYPKTAFIDVMIADINGVLRGKRLTIDGLEKAFKGEFVLPVSVLATQITGDCVEETGLSLDSGDYDLPCMPIDNTLCPSPWQRKPMAQVLTTLRDEQNRAHPLDPRQVLQRLLNQLTDMGLHPVVAVELEFFLFDQQRDALGKPQPPLSPVTGARDTNTQVYGLIELDDYHALIEEISETARLQGIPANAAVAEYAPGQFEINLKHVNDPVLACDQALLLKRLVKGVAARHGFDASFMAKPYPELSGSGMHIHISVLDEQGNNVFSEGQDSALMRNAIGGLVDSMRDTMLAFAPHANSYHRFQKNGHVPMAPAWGFNNRTVALRIPESSPANMRIEHRGAGADANPYLVLAAIVAGMIDGFKRKPPAPAPIEGNAHKQLEPSLPCTWLDAIKQFESSEFCQQYFTSEFVDLYSTVKRSEYDLYNRQIPTFEYDWYLRTV